MNHKSSVRQTKVGVSTPRQNDREESVWSQHDYSPSRGERRLLTWMSRVASLPGKATFRMALLIIESAVKHRRKLNLMITSQNVTVAGMSRVAAYEGLRTLQSAGLVTVKRCRRCSPLVTIIDDHNSDPIGD